MNEERTNIFIEMKEADHVEIFAQHLTSQVDFNYDSLKDFLERTGINNCTSFIDIGCGNGLLTARLAEDYPYITFTGIDLKEEYIEQAKNIKVEKQLKNLNFKLTNAMNYLNDASDVHDGAMMRYSLIHMPDFKSVIKKLASNLDNKASLWIIDCNLSEMACTPSHKAFELLRNLFKRVFDRSNLNLDFALKVLPELEACGFTNITKELDQTTNQNISNELFQKFMINECYLFKTLMPDIITDEEIKVMEDFVENIVPRKDYLMHYGSLNIHAKKG
ncbi:class I SAM-dependent methyltransferase [bacterium]|nr:class I SAM-dependent methyltransferase [bacterium]